MPRREPQTVSSHQPFDAPTGGRPRAAARAVIAGGAALALAVALAGCSSGTSPSTSSSSAPSSSSAASSAVSGSIGYPAGKEQICQARDQLKTSITALTNPTLLVGGGADAIKAAVSQVQTDLGAVVAAGKQDYEPQVTAVQSSLQELQTAVGNLGNGNVTQNMQAVGTAIAATGTAAADLFTRLKATCGS